MGQITFSQAETLFNNYNSVIPNSTDANAVWFDINDIATFIANCKANSSVSGIRIYFGKYAPGLTTVFLTATKGSGNADDADLKSLAPLNYGHVGVPPRITAFPKE
ncbi:MAG: hypothetical protein RLZZ546_1394 [Bacteroidota bacterium]